MTKKINKRNCNKNSSLIFLNLKFKIGGEFNMFNNIDEEMYNFNNCVGNQGVVISAQCRVEIQGRFFLLLELEVGSGMNELERVLVLEISRALFNLLQGRVDLCEIRNTLPTVPPGGTLEIRCTFVIGNVAYIVFEIEGVSVRDRLVIVRSPLCDII